jgi:dTDP-4-dehydrorhamnose reductase
MRVFVTGHRGMLGHVAARYFAQNGCNVVTSEQGYQALPHDPLVDEIRSSESTWVVNALGKIKQKCQQPDALIKANTLFPLHLRKRLHADQRLIHASTDCVFSGRVGSYSIDAEPDAEDEYGLSKLLGECVAEPGRAYVLRSSLVGPELFGNAGLMSWFLQQRGAVNGFVNHLWNGLTTLEWSKVCLEIMRGQQTGQAPLWQVGFWPPISKYELLQMIGRVWKHTVPIQVHSTADPVDRSLRPTWLRPPLSEQLVELKRWY